jgi:hypothetical protein
MAADRAYQQLWHVVDGAVRDAFRKHGDYLTPKGQRSAKRSVVKRVTGTVLGFALQEVERQRELAVTDARLATGDHQASGGPMSDAGAGALLPQPIHSFAHVNELAYQAVRRALFPARRGREIRRDARSYRDRFKATTASLRQALLPEADIERKGR